MGDDFRSEHPFSTTIDETCILGMSTINRRSVNRRVTICSVKNYILDQPKVFSCSSLGARQGEVYSLIIRCIGAAQCLHMRRRRHPALPKTLERGTRLRLCGIILKERMWRHAAHFVAQLLNNYAEHAGVCDCRWRIHDHVSISLTLARSLCIGYWCLRFDLL